MKYLGKFIGSNFNLEELDESINNLISSARSQKDIRMANNAIKDLTTAFNVLSPYDSMKKVTIFGSARLNKDSLAYRLTYDLASVLSKQGYVILTGGGPGIMHAGLEGADLGKKIGIAIELPFETLSKEEEERNGWPLARQKMFFTRKLALIRNVSAYIAAPGGFGTLDEVFELLTLLQTGKAKPTPVILLESDDFPYWSNLKNFIDNNLLPNGLIDPLDTSLFKIVNKPDEAVEIINKFYSNYSSLKIKKKFFTITHKKELSQSQLDLISTRRGVLSPLAISEGENCYYLEFQFDKRHWSDLKAVIDIINS